jgi:hypothetical protein
MAVSYKIELVTHLQKTYSWSLLPFTACGIRPTKQSAQMTVDLTKVTCRMCMKTGYFRALWAKLPIVVQAERRFKEIEG